MSRLERIRAALKSADNVTWLQGWYLAMCDGDWEHQEGFKIETLDNPGWSFKASLCATYLEDLEFEKIQVSSSEYDWIYWSRKNFSFEDAGGPPNFDELITIFRNWAMPTPIISKAANYGVHRD